MKIILLITLLFGFSINSSQADLVQIKPGHYSKYVFKSVVNHVNFNKTAYADLYFCKENGGNLKMWWKNEEITKNYLNETFRIQNVEQPLTLQFDSHSLSLQFTNRRGENVYKSHRVPFDASEFKEKICKEKPFERNLPMQNCSFVYSVQSLGDYYELTSALSESNCMEEARDEGFFGIISSRQLIRKTDFGLEEFEYKIDVENEGKLRKFIRFIEFVKTDDF